MNAWAEFANNTEGICQAAADFLGGNTPVVGEPARAATKAAAVAM
jgi:hypothetical protein